MNNLPDSCTSQMVEDSFRAVPRNIEFCADCLEPFRREDMHPWQKHDWHLHSRVDVYLCDACVPRCGWRFNDAGIVPFDLRTCGRIQSPDAQGPWCAEHDKESEKLDMKVE